jgi:hypothetical protein
MGATVSFSPLKQFFWFCPGGVGKEIETARVALAQSFTAYGDKLER